MSSADPALAALIDRVRAARADGTALAIQGGGSKRFYGEALVGEPLDVRDVCGITSHQPTELVVTARCGTPLAELEAALAEKGQWLPFEPPHFGGGATVGGMVAAGLAGPARAAAGSVRDFVLGASLLDGRAEVLTFGGQVMKNVAGYDVSRLLAGSLGILGVIVEVSLKVVPVAPAAATLRFDLGEAAAIAKLNAWAGQPLPIDAGAWWDGALLVRLRGATAAVAAATASLGGDRVGAEAAAPFWAGLRDQRDEFFVAARAAVDRGEATLWRLSVPSTTPPLGLSGSMLVEWAGALRWLCSSADAATVRDAAQRCGGHATRWLSHGAHEASPVFAPLAPPLERIHRELKLAFDPDRVFNRGRLYPDL